jgi:hypothetical protein
MRGVPLNTPRTGPRPAVGPCWCGLPPKAADGPPAAPRGLDAYGAHSSSYVAGAEVVVLPPSPLFSQGQVAVHSTWGGVSSHSCSMQPGLLMRRGGWQASGR